MSRSVVLSAFLVLAAVPACSNKSEPKPSAKAGETAPAPSATPAAPVAPATASPALKGVPAGLNLAITAPKTASTIEVPHAGIEAVEEAQDGAAYKQELIDSGEGTVESMDKLADGWAIRYKTEEGLVHSVVQRTIAGRVLRCKTQGDDQKQIDQGRSVCDSIQSPDGDSLVVAFALPPEDEEEAVGISVSIDDAMLSVGRATESSAKTADEAFTLKHTGKIEKSETFAGGFSMVASGQNGDIAGQGPYVATYVREKVGAFDLECRAWGPTKSVEHGLKIVEACRAIRSVQQ